MVPIKKLARKPIKLPVIKIPVIKRPKITHEIRNRVRWAIFHTALVVFTCDLIAAFWPAFDHVWTHVAHLCVATATVLAALAEWLAGAEENEVQRLLKEHQDRKEANDDQAA